MITQLLTTAILLSLLLPIINWALSLLFMQAKLPRILFVFTEILVIVATLLAITATLLDYHLIINRTEFTLTIFAPYLLCLAIIQMFYVRQQYKISFIFATNLVTLGLALPALYFLPVLLYTMPILLYYGMHTFILTICDIFYWDNNTVSGFIRKQTWINKIHLLESSLPKKNINAYILSSAASFSYSSLNLCVLLSYKTMAIPEHIALGLTCTLLIFSGIITFALLVKYDEAGNVAFPGCLLIHYIIQSYQRCENLVSGNFDLKPKLTLRSLFFAIILGINGLGSTAFAMASVIPEEQPSFPVGEGQYVSREAQAARQTMSWVGSEMAQGASEIPRTTTSSIGSLGTGAVGAYLYSNMTAGTQDVAGTGTQAENPEQARIKALEEQVKELQSALKKEQNKTFFQRYFKCFG